MITTFQTTVSKELKNKRNRSSIVWSNLVLPPSWHPQSHKYSPIPIIWAVALF